MSIKKQTPVNILQRFEMTMLIKSVYDCIALHNNICYYKKQLLQTKLTEKSHSEADCRSASQEIPRRLQNTKGHYCAYKSPPLVHIMSQLNAEQNLLFQDPFSGNFSSAPCFHRNSI
jgi:hypothetical protein